MGERPYSYVIHSHELYNMGHLYEAAVACARATGKTKLLEVAEKNAQHVNRVLFEGDPDYNGGRPVDQAPGHQEIEIGLIRLYEHTVNPLYLEMAKRFLDTRGVTFTPHGEGIHSPEYAQQHRPVAKQERAVGHAVRACCMYAAMAGVDSLTGKNEYGAALDSIWHDIVDAKMHVSGGLGAAPHIEGFGPRYVLPNKDAYPEICAAVGKVLFNLRMFLKHGEGRYVDVAEAALYNNCLSGIGLEGTSFFYPNPLQADAGHAPRSAWFGAACCPSNLARLIPRLSGQMYAADTHSLYCVLYGSNTGSVKVGGRAVGVVQETNYPFDGAIDLRLDPAAPMEFELAMRIPTWAGEQFVPGELYHYANPAGDWRLTVNGEPVDAPVEKGIARVRRRWEAGDRVRLELPMPVRVNGCLDLVEANHGRVALTRGPLLLSAEEIDNDGDVERLFIDGGPSVSPASVDTFGGGLLAGLPRVTLTAKELTGGGVRDRPMVLIPYFAWSNRDRGSMTTWIGVTQRLAKVDLRAAENLKFAGVTASHTFEGDTVDAVRMKHTPSSSFDMSTRRWTGWPQRGERQWVEIDLDDENTIKSVGV